ncbi:cytochrome c [Arboricoccus pini]|uniref:Cytochrome c n=1 Tax=Arboricoccus pini TaxID=1963835 RepID=A0A212R4T5_9PROT|nr:c-type cytochrome [Arboricoccus pini]SNB67042.1 cytochrome c [Arboricoccus pini]
MEASLEGQKFIGAILTGAILAIGSGVLAGIIYSPHKPEHNAYQVDVSVLAAGGGESAAQSLVPIAQRLAAADAGKGAATAKVCLSCHTFDEGAPNKIGPNLYDTVGEEIGKGKASYPFSPALSGHGGKWDYENLDRFLTSPKEFAPGTKMSFAGLSKPDQRANVIAFLRSLSADPVPLPTKDAPDNTSASGSEKSGTTISAPAP